MNRIFSFILLMLCLCLMINCSNEEEQAFYPNSEGKRIIALDVTVPGSPSHSMSRAATEAASASENYIDYVYITISAKKDGKYEKYKEVFERPWTKETAISETFSCAVEDSWLENTSELTATVFANYKEGERFGIINDEAAFWKGDNLNVLRKLLMSGSSPISAEGDGFKGTVDIQRQVAKLRLKVQLTDDRVPVGLTVLYDSVRVAVQNVADRADTILTLNTVYAPFNQKYISFKERGGNSLRIYKEEVDGELKHIEGTVVDSCYVYENIIKNYSAGQKTTLSVTIPTYDPVADHREDLHGVFEIKGEDKDSYDIKRNHIYTMIVKIRSQREPLNITSIVQPWDVRTGDIGDIEPVKLP